MSERPNLATLPGRAYRWWGVGAIAFLVLGGIGVLGGVPLMVLGSGDLSWLRWVGTAAVFVLIPVGVFGAIYCGHKRYHASFANAHISEGRIAEVSEVHNSEDHSFYFMLTVSTAVDGGPTIRRHCTMGGKHPRPEIGQTLRFRHATLDPDNLEDALFDSIPDHR